MRCKSISNFMMCFMLSLFSLTAYAQIKITGTASDAATGILYLLSLYRLKVPLRVRLPIWMENIQLRYLMEMPF